jgi:hypothetical protein
MTAAIKSGKWVHKAPIGYVTDPKAPGGLALDTERAPFVRKAFEMFANGESK